MNGRSGFNLVEILVALVLVSLLSSIVIGLVSDYKDMVNTSVAESDLHTIAQMCALAESNAGTILTTVSVSGTSLSTVLDDYIISLPPADPWGHRFMVSADGTVVRSNTEGVAYIVDVGMGRVICAGPDGEVDTRIGAGPPSDRDIVVVYRTEGWLFYNLGGWIYTASSDGSMRPVAVCSGTRMVVSPDRSRFLAVRNQRIIWGEVDPRAQVHEVTHPDLPLISDSTYPLWSPDSRMILVPQGDLYVIYAGGFSSTVKRLTVGAPLNTDDNSGTITSDRCTRCTRKGSWYFNPGTETYMAVSPDGKIAYTNKATGDMEMILADGTGRRIIKKSPSGNPLRPLLWLGSDDLIYADDSWKRVWRIKQDGTYDFPLLSSDLPTGIGGISAVSLSPDSRFLYFRLLGTSYKDSFRVVCTDGSGAVGGTNTVITGYELVSTPAVWIRDMLYLPVRKGGGTEKGIQEARIEKDASLSYVINNVAVLADNATATDLVPYAWDVSCKGGLIALVSSSSGGYTTSDGVFVLSVRGPESARYTLSSTPPAAGDVFSIYWVK